MSEKTAEERFYISEYDGSVCEILDNGDCNSLEDYDVIQQLNQHADEIRAAVQAERARIAGILSDEILAIQSGKEDARFVGVSPLGLLTEVLGIVRAEPDDGDGEDGEGG